jgi:hypothetical protein
VVRSCLAPAQIERVVALVNGIEKQASLEDLVAIVGAPTWRG